MLTLYDYELSAECYAVRLLLSILGVAHEVRPVDVYPGREHEQMAFREKSPLASVPVLESDGLRIWDWQAILIYLATAHDPTEAWYPRQDAGRLALVAQWMSVGTRLAGSAGLARLHQAMFVEADLAACQVEAHRLLRVLDEHLWFQEQADESWIVDGSPPTLADLALFPSVMLSEEGGINRRDYPAVRRWCDQFKRLPGFKVMSGIFPAAPPVLLAAASRS